MADDSASGLSFPDGPKLELDQLIDQLVERAHDVKRAQGRLRRLVAAIDVVTGELGIESVLLHVIEAAAGLAGARYGALGVIGSDGNLEQFIHTGLDPDTVDRIGALPTGKGLLGALITDPHAIRLADLSEDARSSGFPPHHPSMSSFLGAPIRVGGEVYGNIYLTESERGEFSAEDEELVRAFAVTAGSAIANARLYEESNRQQRWLTASAEISGRLIANSGEDPLRMIARRAHDASNADFVSLALRVPDAGDFVVEVAVGANADELIGRRFALSDSIIGVVIDSAEPILLRSMSEAPPDRVSHVSSALDLGPLMIVPLVGSSEPSGALSIARRAGRAPFTAADLAMTIGFANHASLALELAEARTDQQRVALLEDRDRIARDLHDHVIQQLFSTGLSLEGLASRLRPDDAVGAKMRDLVANLDTTIRQIRTSIFELRGSLATPSDGVRSRILSVAGELTAALRFSPSVTFAGAIDADVSDGLADEVVACVRESLTNVAKHAHAKSVLVDVSVAAGEVTVRVCDDGGGISDTARRSGLANLRTRAEVRGGTLTVTAGPAGGTDLIWKAPLK